MSETLPKQRTKEDMLGVRVIAIFKLIKGFLLACVGFGALALIDRDVAELAARLVADLRVDPENHFIHALMVKLGLVNNHMLRQISVGTFLYSTVLLFEGFGLMWDKLWAEYLTVVVTSLFLPVEFYEVFRHATKTKMVVIGINVMVVWYLVSRLKLRKKEREAGVA